MDVKKLFEAKINRRRVLGNLGMMGAGAALTACGVNAQPNDDDYDAAILNFALNLEYLEAAFYLAAVGRITELPGYSADKVLVPDGFDPTQGIPFPDPDNDAVAAMSSVGEYANEIASDELAHVNFLRDQLGANAGALPTIDLNASFKAAAGVAFGMIANPSDLGLPMGFTPDQFEPLSTGPLGEALFLHGAFIFEDVGVTAYKGAARYIVNPNFLEAAAGILAVEAYHAGEVRTFLYGADRRRANLYNGLDTWTITAAISAARDGLDGSAELDEGIVAEARFGLTTQAHGGANIVPTNNSAIAYSRTPRQVANIVLLTSDNSATTGGFFPGGFSVPAALAADTTAILDPSFPNNLDD